MDENKRLQTLSHYQGLKSVPGDAYQELVELAAELCATPIAMINFVGADHLKVMAAVGTGSKLENCDRQDAFCHTTIQSDSVHVIEDTWNDPVFRDNPFVTGENKIRFYAAAPLICADGFRIGTLCVCGPEPRRLTDVQARALKGLAKQIVFLLDNQFNDHSLSNTANLLALMNETSTAANESASHHEGIGRCIDAICKYMHAPVGHYVEIDPNDAQRLISSGLWYLQDAKVYGSLRSLTETLSLPADSNILTGAFQTGEPAWRLKIKFDDSKPRSRACQDLGLNAAFAFPVKIKGKVVGIFEFFLHEEFEPGERLFKIMNHVSAQIAHVIERAQADEALEKQTEFLNSVLDALGNGVVACDANGKISVVNRALREFHGIPLEEEMAFDKWPEHFTVYRADGRTPLKPDEIPILRAFNGEYVKESNLVLVPNNGPRRELRASGRPIFDRQGRKLGAVVAITDLTEVMIAQRKLEATSESLQNLIDRSPAGIYLLNRDATVAMWNPACEKIFGWPSSEAVGHYRPNVPKHLIEYVNNEIKARWDDGSTNEAEVTAMRKDGTSVVIRYNTVPMFGGAGEIVRYMTVVYDISDIKQRETNLIASNKALQAATEAKSAFLANMSHEIRTPLNGVIGMTDLLLDSELDAEQRQHVEVLQSSAESLLSIISDILDFSKAEAGHLAVESIEFDLGRVVGDVHRSLDLMAKKKNLELTYSIIGGADRLVGDPTRIRQVLVNLINNAIKFTSVGSVSTTVKVVPLDSGRASVRFDVHDTGIGISPATLNTLFKPFVQADSSTTRKFGGTGLGLSISKKLVELMNGSISASSIEGKGATFTFTLDLQDHADHSSKRLSA